MIHDPLRPVGDRKICKRKRAKKAFDDVRIGCAEVDTDSRRLCHCQLCECRLSQKSDETEPLGDLLLLNQMS